MSNCSGAGMLSVSRRERRFGVELPRTNWGYQLCPKARANRGSSMPGTHLDNVTQTGEIKRALGRLGIHFALFQRDVADAFTRCVGRGPLGGVFELVCRVRLGNVLCIPGSATGPAPTAPGY